VQGIKKGRPLPGPASCLIDALSLESAHAAHTTHAAHAAHAAGSGCAAVVRLRLAGQQATEAAFCRAERTTLVGSNTPALSSSSYFSVAALKPNSPLPPRTLSKTTAPSKPVLAAIWRRGSSMARLSTATPTFWVSFRSSLAKAFWARSRATPPPTTTPSSTAARVAFRASSTRAFFSFISASEAAPTLMTATPPASLASRSCSFSRS